MFKSSTLIGLAFSAFGLWAVLSFSAFAQVTAGKTAPRTAFEPAGIVYISRSNTSDNGNLVSESGTLYTVPPGKRLVIETISARVLTAQGQSVIGNVSTRTGGQSASTNLIFVFQGNDRGQAKYAATHDVRLYAEAGSNVTYTTVRTDTNAVGNKNVSFTGYLEPAG